MRVHSRPSLWHRLGVLGPCAAIALGTTSPARGQEEIDEESLQTPEQAIETYLERLGLSRLLAEQLEQRLNAAPREQRIGMAERLSKLYVELLTSAQAPEDRQLWEDKAKALLALVPEADSFDLRLSLGRAVYSRAEDIAERSRLRMATPEEIVDADKTFRTLISQFNDIATKAHRRVDTLEKIEQQGDASDKLMQELSDARRQRSLAFYFAGWANYYLSLLTKAEQPAVDALRCFGWLLNSSGSRPATLDRVQPGMLQYEHVARSVVGCALCSSLRGNDVEAIRWLDFVEESEQTPAAVKDQLFSRRIAVLAQSKRWADLELLIRRARRADRSGGGPNITPLQPLVARQIVVATLEADKRTAGPQIEQLAKIALGDLVARREIAHVLDLVGKFGTAPIGDTGFIVHYVRALQAYQAARVRHESLKTNADEPTSDAETVNLYRAAAGMFLAADQQSDAEQFRVERVRAAVIHGRSLFFAGDLAGAADVFVNAWKTAGKQAGGEEPLWLAVLALERAAKDQAIESPPRRRLTETITLFLQNYPESDKAPRLTLMQVSLGTVQDDDALIVLQNVPKESPVYEAARRQVARILYNKFRASRGQERDFAAQRFIAVAEEVLAADRRTAMEGNKEDAKPAVDRVVVRARQLLDALLSTQTPDVVRAESVLKILGGVATYNNLDLTPFMAELTFREVQMAIARGSAEQVESAGSRLYQTPDPTTQFHSAGERLLYRFYAQRYKPGDASAENIEAASLVIKHGRRVVDRVAGDPSQLQDPALVSLYSTVSDAALTRSIATGETDLRDLSMRLDKAILNVQPRTEVVLRRLARSSEAAGDFSTATSCWRTVQESAQAGSGVWFEARYEGIRVLSKVDPGKARAAIAEHKILYPDGGAAPWGPKIIELEQSLPAEPTSPAPAATPSNGASSSSGGGS